MLYIAVRPCESPLDQLYWAECEQKDGEFYWDSLGLAVFFYKGTLQQFEIDHPDILSEFQVFREDTTSTNWEYRDKR